MRKLYFSFIAFLILFSTVNFAQIVAPVTFRLDLNDVIGSVPNSDSAQVFIQTNVANWVDIPMQDIGGNGIWRKNINITHPLGQDIDVFYRFKVTSFGTNGLPYTLWEGGGNADTTCIFDPNTQGLAGGGIRKVVVPQELIDNGTYVNPTGEFKLTHCFNICGNSSCPPPPCNGILQDSAWQQCWTNQSAIVFEWWTDVSSPGCDVVKLYYGNEEGYQVTIPGLWEASNGYNNFAAPAGNGQMPPNWSVEHYLVLEFVNGTLSDTISFTPTACIEGCTDPTQISYNPWATEDDGSCSSGGSCDPIDHEITIEITLDNWPGETSWTLVSLSDGGIPINAPPGEYDFSDVGQTYTYTVCIDTLGVEFIINDTYGDGLGGTTSGGSIDGNVIIYDCDGNVIWSLSPGVPNANFGSVYYSGPLFGSACASVPDVLGCTDPAYQEFNPLANVDDGSCLTPHIFGCIDTSAFNYNPAATMMQVPSTCDYTLIIEDDAGDGWGNSFLGVHQNGNLWNYTMGPGPYNQTFNLQLSPNYPVEIYYFEVAGPQQPPQEIEFQTWHNSFTLINSYGDTLLSEGTNPFANNGQGALQPFEDPFYEKYIAYPNCGDLCIPKIYGCTDSLAHPDSYNPNANVDDGSCFYNPGCNNQGFVEFWDADSNVVDFWSIDYCYTPAIFGCMDVTSYNYNPAANVEPAGTCVPFIYGCTDPTAFNYNANANTDDGSCEPYIFGCTDPTAFNYDSTANTDNGSCIPVVYGCTDSTSLNYDPNANTDNGSCITAVPGCTDPSAYNYDPFANITDSTACLYDAGCITGPGNPYWLNDQCYAWVISIDPYCCEVDWDANCQNTYDYCSQNSGWVGIEDLIAEGGIVVYPNPTNGELNVASSRVKNIIIKMYSISGKVVVNETNNNVINISHLESGVYFMEIKIGDLTYIRKVIKQ